MKYDRSIWIGFDPRERDAFHVAVASIRAHLSEDIEIFAVALPPLVDRGLYQRPTVRKDGQLWDIISAAPMSTEFALSRFLVPYLAEYHGTALFMDCDMLVRVDLAELFALADKRYAVQCVKHAHEGAEGVKMDGQAQTAYPRKNWSSVMLFNLGHPANAQLTPRKVNTWKGSALHRLMWLEDHEIGELGPEWNHLVGVNDMMPDAKIAHFTLGIPSMAGYEQAEFADEWRSHVS
jgi:hypothetical protein